MGSPVSVVVAEIVMQRLEEKALATYTNPPPFWFRYVDDTLTSLHKDEKNNFLEHLNQQNPSIQFTIEPELNGKIAFLDCRVIRAGNTLQTSVYRKPTSTDRLLDNSSYHPASHKSATIKTLVKRAHVVCSSSEDLKTELQHLNEIFDVNNYPKPFVRGVTEQFSKPTADNEISNTSEDKKVIATIPYVKGTSERIARILRPYNIVVAHKPTTTLRDVLTRVKDPSPKNSRVGTVYKITCAECPASYLGETGRTLECRIKEHKRCIANKDASNSIAVHHMATRHEMDWEGATCLEYASHYGQRMFLESWHTKSEKDSINVCREMPGAYYSLIANERARAECERTRRQSRNRAADAR
jgi:hypothetical protein